MSEHAPTPSRPAEANVVRLVEDEPEEPEEILTEAELVAALAGENNEVKRSLLEFQLRIVRNGSLREGAERARQADAEKRAAEAAAAAEREDRAAQARRDARPIGLPEVPKVLAEMGIPGRVDAAKYRHRVTIGEFREAKAQLEADSKITALNAGIVNHRAQLLAAKRANKPDATCAGANRPALAVVSRVASTLATG